MKSLQELANEGVVFKDTEPELIKQNLFATIKEASIRVAVGRQITQLIPYTGQGVSGVLEWNLADKDSLTVRKVAEGGIVPLDVEAYTKITLTAEKYGARVGITREMIEDANWPLIERNLKEIGRQMSYKEDEIIFDSFADATTGFPLNADHDITSAGTELGISDITNGMKEIEEQDYHPDTMVLHPTQVNELRQIDTFVEANKVGDRRVFERGWVGRIFGIDSVFSTKLAADTVYIIDKMEAGVLGLRRPLTVEKWSDPLKDLENAVVTQRMVARVVRQRAGVRITVQ